ncbi:MAG TPA: AmmeMemoRadiSam system protein A [Thermoanaerobaculia bacterium]|nr:AmmeMemoRadiSam system protein A [Thermoanaerobaculia bacterium]
MATDEWTSERGRTLLRIARAGLAEALGFGKAPEEPGELWLREPGATFVTLRRRGELRGCVGSILAYRPLFEDVWRNARASAFHDTRFPPVEPGELVEIDIEMSLLSAPEPLPCASESEALCLLRPGVDGVILECGEHRGTFLPQVWEQLPNPHDFLDRLRHKAGLRHGYWSPEVRLSRYTVLKWVEE